MNTVKLVKASRVGYFLTIGDNDVKHRWAVTAFELLTLLKMLKDNEMELRKEVYDIKDAEGLPL